ncbi:nuclear transport factor 2 family protein [Streptomyces sp. NPDC002225]|uniref:nuclear transport factor 2 family protein n=1 Tax=Streptomyces sp. NPDC002225 TaxID=3154413 RepID=UPI00332EAAC4
MTTTADLRAAVETYWSAAEARDWDALAAILADDVLYEVPQTREYVRGKERYLRFSRACPEGRSVRVESVVTDAGARRAAVRTHFVRETDPDPDQGLDADLDPFVSEAGAPGAHRPPGESLALHFFVFDEAGRISAITGFRPEPRELSGSPESSEGGGPPGENPSGPPRPVPPSSASYAAERKAGR